MCACLGVICHLHFWQNDQDLLRASAVTQGWNKNKSKHTKFTLEKKTLSPLLPGFELATFLSRVRRSTNNLSRSMCTKANTTTQQWKKEYLYQNEKGEDRRTERRTNSKRKKDDTKRQRDIRRQKDRQLERQRADRNKRYSMEQQTRKS